jgi:3-deoxy-D-manno-octulosonic-acid transferase
MGGTLSGRAGGGRHPFEAAALGSALIHGSATAHHKDAWARLDVAGATRLVRDGAELGRAVEELLASDRAASMAHAGWDVATQGAEVANRVADLVREQLTRTEPIVSAETAAPALAAPLGA